jgi:hypothetical protein
MQQCRHWLRSSHKKLRNNASLQPLWWLRANEFDFREERSLREKRQAAESMRARANTALAGTSSLVEGFSEEIKVFLLFFLCCLRPLRHRGFSTLCFPSEVL